MTAGLRHVALAVLCSSALIAFEGVAQAGTVSITGGSALTIGPNPLYSDHQWSNNVINAAGVPATGSILYDPTYPGTGPVNSGTPWLMDSKVSFSGTTGYYVNWYFAGSESGYNITLHAPSITPFTEGNQDNNVLGNTWPKLPGGYEYLGQSHYASGDPLSFSLTWGSPTQTVDNANQQPTPNTGGASLVFSYLNGSPVTLGGKTYLELQTSANSDWFVFALNDSGADDNHDDFVGFARISPDTSNAPGPSLTPIPAALPLFGSVLGGGIVVGKWRKRRKKKASV